MTYNWYTLGKTQENLQYKKLEKNLMLDIPYIRITIYECPPLEFSGHKCNRCDLQQAFRRIQVGTYTFRRISLAYKSLSR